MEEIVKLDFHIASKTPAQTRWFISYQHRPLTLEDAEKEGLVKYLYSTISKNKTHWYEYYEILKPVLLEKTRVSNKGNITITEYKPEQLKAPEEEVKAIKLMRR